MMLKEIIKSCGIPSVAEAAVRSIGVDFADEVRFAASARGLSLGTYAAEAVRNFDREASPEDRQALFKAIRRTDQPILVGLRFILGRASQDDADTGWRGNRGFSIAGRTAQACCHFC